MASVMYEDSTNSDNSNASSSSTYVSASIPGFKDFKQIRKAEKLSRRTSRREERVAIAKNRAAADIEQRKKQAVKGMNFLLTNSQMYSQYFLERLKTIDNPESAKGRNVYKDNCDTRKRKLNNNEVAIYLDDEQIAEFERKIDVKSTKTPKIRSKINKKEAMVHPKYFVGSLHPYQFDGLVWLKLLYENGINGILADEMGLGKTIQVIALICHLIQNKINGPYLVVAPLSTLPNWYSEFKRFAPQIPVVLFHGSKQIRPTLYPKINRTYSVGRFKTAPVVITSYQMPLIEKTFLKQHKWQYLIIDEGHKIKNFNCQLALALKQLTSLNRLILTGTPLQNNLGELWSLLNFLLPQFFQDVDTFASLFVIEDFQTTDKIIKQEQSTNIISTIQGVLNPFMLRRLKSDVLTNLVPKKEVLVYCPLSPLQKNLYKFILQKNMHKLLGKEEEIPDVKIGKRPRLCTLKNSCYRIPDENDDFEYNTLFTRDVKLPEMQNKDKKKIMYNVKMACPWIMLKKTVNHPFSIHCPINETTREVVIDEDIIKQSGKMMVLDAMLARLKKENHKVLIFSTLTTFLDFIEDLMCLRDYSYCRLDGSRSLSNRQESINSFNSDPEQFAFLVSTRAGGLGLNLTAADTVILFDRDWNPQVDIQAQDRCHRIGQTKPVMVYTFVTKGTIDEHIMSIATSKRRLEKIVIKKGKFTNPEENSRAITDLKELEELLNSDDHTQVIQSNGYVFSDKELDRLLDRTELYEDLARNKKLANFNI